MLTLQTKRQEKGWSKAELARRANLNASTISAIERGYLHPYPAQARKLARALGIPASEAESLMEEVE